MSESQRLNDAARQQQFLRVIDRDEATARFHEHLTLAPLEIETVPLDKALNRTLALNVVAEVDVPAFDRSNVDGFAVQSSETRGAMEESPRTLKLNREILQPGEEPHGIVQAGTATTIATGAVVPRGADSIVMVEHTNVIDSDDEAVHIEVRQSVTPGQRITFAGTDIARGETVLRMGQQLTSREIGVLAAIGVAQVDVYRQPRIAIISTGDEIVPPGQPLPTGSVYDSNASIIAAAVEELGGEPVHLGSVPDDVDRLRAVLNQAMECDMVVLSGGTSKGAGDLSYRVVSQLENPGIVAHGVALKPGKPICLAVSDGKPVVILPGFPTSAIFTFHEFVAPVIRAFAGKPTEHKESVTATLPLRVNSERGRTEFLLVGLIRSNDGLSAYPMGKGSGSVTTFSRADGFITIGQHTEIVEAGSQVTVQLLGQKLEPADLVFIGSHCVGLDILLDELHQRGVTSKVLHVGSMGGLAAAKRGECDVAGIHLMDPETGEYNRPFLTDELKLVNGYRRMQGFLFRPGDERFENRDIDDAVRSALTAPACRMINRNAGSGTRILIERLLDGQQPAGYPIQAKSHNAVATAVKQGRADWGVAIDTVANLYELSFIPLLEEHYDFAIPILRFDRPEVQLVRELLLDDSVQDRLRESGFRL